tara:strand:- start:5 stop:343 length:339 start_codon:yes stop_codon:yes gene_type:complete
VWNKLYRFFPITSQLRTIVALTLIDLVFTIYWVGAGHATEANPLLNYFLNYGMVTFAFVKLALGLGSILILFRNLNHWLVKLTVPMILFSYVWLTLHHCRGIYYWLINLLAG